MLVDSATHNQWQDILMNFVAFPGIGLILLWLFLVNTRFGEKLTWRTLLPMPLVGIAMAAVGFFATQPTKVLGDHCKAHVIKDVAGRTTGQTHELYGTVEYRFANGTTTELKGEQGCWRRGDLVINDSAKQVHIRQVHYGSSPFGTSSSEGKTIVERFEPFTATFAGLQVRVGGGPEFRPPSTQTVVTSGPKGATFPASSVTTHWLTWD